MWLDISKKGGSLAFVPVSLDVDLPSMKIKRFHTLERTMHYTNYVILQLLCPKKHECANFFFNKKSKFLNTDTYKMPPFSYKRKKNSDRSCAGNPIRQRRKPYPKFFGFHVI